MLYDYVSQIPTEMLEEFEVLVKATTTLTPLNLALVIWLDRNLPCRMSPPEKALSLRDLSTQERLGEIRDRSFGPRGLNTRSGVWIPLPEEVESCCKTLLFPRVAWGYKQHCNSVRHVAIKLGVDSKVLYKSIQAFLKPFSPMKAEPSRCQICQKFVRRGQVYCALHQLVEDASKEWAIA